MTIKNSSCSKCIQATWPSRTPRVRADEAQNSCGDLPGILTGSWQAGGAGRPQAGHTALTFRNGSGLDSANHTGGNSMCCPRQIPEKTTNKGWWALYERRLRSQAGSVCSVIKSCQAKLIFSVDRVTRLVDKRDGVSRCS